MDVVPRETDAFWGSFDEATVPTDPQFDTTMHEYDSFPKFADLERTYSWEI